MSSRYFELLNLITEKGPITQTKIINKYRFTEDSTNIKNVLNELVSNKDVLSQKKRSFIYYYVAPAQLVLQFNNKYKLTGHPHSEMILKEEGNINFENINRYFSLTGNEVNLKKLCTNYGINLRR